MKFYTSFHSFKDKILVRGYEDGKPFTERVPYSPYLFIPTREKTNYRTIDDLPVEKIEFESMSAARDFIRSYAKVENFKLYGMTNFPYVYIADEYTGKIDFNPEWVRVANIDIEVLMQNGISNEVIERAADRITVITLRHNKISYVFALPPEKEFGKFYPDRNTEGFVQYKEFRSEFDLLDAFLTKFNELGIDVITGWNVELFDVVYIVNRIKRLMGEDHAKRLSPWKLLEQKTIEIFGKEQTIHLPVGVSILDMLHLYKKFTYTQQESYKLDYICSEELGEKKLDYSDYDGLNDLYFNNWAKYVRYNIHDTTLVEKLNDKLKLLELVYTLAYDAKCSYNDTLATVRPWDVKIHEFMMNKGLVVPFNEDHDFRPYEGGYVKTPIPGGYRWVMNFDVTSEYPSLMLQYNMSPETLIPGKLPWDINVDSIMEQDILNWDHVKEHFRSRNNSVSAAGYMFTKEKMGIFTEIVQNVFDDRVKYKKLMITAKKKFEETGSKEDENSVAMYNNLQMAKKIQLNSLYGAVANQYFRWFRMEIAESITLSGQMTVRWAERAVNKYLNKILKTDNDYVIAIDTDSIYVCFDKLVAHIFGDDQSDKQKIVDFLDRVAEEKIQKILDEAFKEMAAYTNAFQQKIFMKREAIADFGIWTAKKRYALNVWDNEGVRYKEPKIKIVGLEAIRSTTPSPVRNAIKDCIKIIMNKTEDDLFEYVEEFRKKFYTMRFEDIANPIGVKGLTKYSDKYDIYSSGTPMHVRGSLLYNKAIKDAGLSGKYNLIQEGEKIKFAYLKVPNPIRENVIACNNSLPPELGLHEFIDYEAQFDKCFFEPIKRISDILSWDIVRRLTLDEFFA